MSTGSTFFGLIDPKAYPKPEEAARLKIGIVTALWNHEYTEQLTSGCTAALRNKGVISSNIFLHQVPGCFEIPLGCQWLHQYSEIDALIALGCLIKGETPHFEFIAESATQGLMDLMLRINKPIVNGILTVYSNEQALERLGGSHGHKGKEAAETSLQMIQLKASLTSTAI